MNITVTPGAQALVLNEAAPIVVFSLAFVIAMGGAFAVATALCGWGNVNMASVDFWKAQVKIQCET